MSEGNPPPSRPEVGLCSTCRFAAVQRSRRGGAFWRCRRAETEPTFSRYPPLPVARCAGFARGEPEAEPVS